MIFNNIVSIYIYSRNDGAISIKVNRILILLPSTRDVSVSQLRKDFLFHTLIFFFLESRNIDRLEISLVSRKFHLSLFLIKNIFDKFQIFS